MTKTESQNETASQTGDSSTTRFVVKSLHEVVRKSLVYRVIGVK